MSTIITTPRKRDFPRLGSPEEQLRFLLRYAVLAPSTHNTQPWLWEIEDDEVVLRADRSRALTALDPHGRELIMSCGVALQHLCLAIRAFGYAALVQTLPDPRHPDILARVRLASARPADPDDELLFQCIGKRHTHRGHFEGATLPTSLLRTLQEDAEHEGAELFFAQNEEQRRLIVELIESGDLIQNRDPGVRRDIADWITPDGSRADGIPASALGMGKVMSHLVTLTHGFLTSEETVANKNKKLAVNAPVLVVLSTRDEGPQSWLAAGMALGRVLLRARSEGVWASFFSQPIQVDQVWLELRRMMDMYHFPQLVFRLGYAQPVQGTPRRPVEEVSNIVPVPDDAV